MHPDCAFLEIVATHIDHELALDASHPAREWQNASPVTFYSDWQGKNPDPETGNRGAGFVVAANICI